MEMTDGLLSELANSFRSTLPADIPLSTKQPSTHATGPVKPVNTMSTDDTTAHPQQQLRIMEENINAMSQKLSQVIEILTQIRSENATLKKGNAELKK